jgi:hypothetical protein
VQVNTVRIQQRLRADASGEKTLRGRGGVCVRVGRAAVVYARVWPRTRTGWGLCVYTRWAARACVGCRLRSVAANDK